MHILRFTPQVAQMINLVPTDLGRPLGHIVSNLVGYDHLVEDVKDVLTSLIPTEIEVQIRNCSWHLMRIMPYHTLENVIMGAVITFIDITEMRRMKKIRKDFESMRRLALVVYDLNDAITLQDLMGHILAWNQKAEIMYGWSEAEALTMNISSMSPDSLKEKELAILNKLISTEVLEPYHTQRLAKDGQIMEVWLTATPLVNETGEVYAIATTEREITSESTKTEIYDYKRYLSDRWLTSARE